ncbi:MAG TPA: glycosyl hydrolase family 18 protein, partial [Candidatus Limnocylindrales bacterium]|nr:glycosyl hydrolase family 18 protein [Candidatus Limnocylindrales bacterium]
MPSPATPATPADSFGRRLLAAVAVGSLLTSVTMVPIATAAPPPVDAGPVDAGAVDLGAPSIHYEEAMAHAGDRIAFEPGGRVRVGFRPRPGTADVAGQRSRPLPAGRASGHEMAAAPQGSVWTPVGSEGDRHPIDGPAVDAGSVVLEADLTAAHDLAGLEPAATLAATAGLRREVFGFLPYWQLNSSSLRLDYDLLSTIAYFSVPADRAGNLVKRNSDGTIATGWAGWTSSRLTSVIDAAHARGTRVVLTVTMFAWTTAQRSAQAAFLGDETARRNLARQAAAAVRDRGADGINLDFEPIASGYAEEYAAFVRDVRRELDAIAPGYQLTVDTTGHIGNYPLEELVAPGAADAIFIMGYDYRTAGADYAGSIAPLAGPAYDLTDTVRAYVARVPASALILGVPYYGRAWSTVSDALNAQTRSDSRYGSSVTAVYTTAVSLAAQYGRRYDSTEHSPWTAYRRQYCSSSGCVTTWRQLYYDDAVSLSRKYDLINRY